MRLVLIVPRFPRVSETFIVNKFVGLVDAGWDVHVVCGQAMLEDWENFPPLVGRPELQSRVHQEWQHEPRWIAFLLWLPVLLSTLLRAPQTTWHYWRATWPRFGPRTAKQFYLDAVIIALKPDIIHFEFGALAVGKTYVKNSINCCLSASFRGYDLSYAGLENPDHYSRLWENADAFHALGRDLWQRALRRGCPPDKPHALIPPAIDVGYFVRDSAARRIDPISAERPLRILSVGRLEWVKGYEYALRAVRLLDERGIPFEYHIIGDGSYLEPLAFARHELGLDDQVHFLGGQPHPVVTDEMNWADVFLHAAVSEGFCNAVLEAQAMRLPVVSSDADGLPENVADGQTGFIVPRRDPAALAEKLAQLAEDVELRRAMGAAGRVRVVNCFPLPQQIAAFDRFYRDMVACRAN
jgi:colanic acid/amylovoran biosynthesis glycosyltransferase